MLNDRRATAQTLAEPLRAALTRVEARMGQLDYSTREELLALLPLLDETFALLSSLQERGVAIPSEQARFEAISQKLRRHAGKILYVIGGSQKLVEARQKCLPPDIYWWWFLDVWWVKQQRASLRRIFLRAGAVIVVLAVLAVLYMLFLAPDKSVRMALRYEQEAESACEDGDYAAALQSVETALTYRPDSLDLQVFAGTLRELLLQVDQADATFAIAQGLAENHEAFLLSRAQRYLKLLLPEKALRDAEAMLSNDAASAYGYYIEGNCYEQLGDWEAAEAAYASAETLAASSGDAELEAMARVQRAYLMQMMLLAPVETTPGSEN